ncbi:MAG: helix-turn-helix domain-containing protein [Prevotella sp.]|nr:helix-turn-helix domain-containing protein [Prevotella sp.]
MHALHVGVRVPLTLQQGQTVPKPVEDSPLHQDQWLDNQDLSQLLHVSVRSLQRYRSLGILPYKMMHKKAYYTKEGCNGKPYKTK